MRRILFGVGLGLGWPAILSTGVRLSVDPLPWAILGAALLIALPFRAVRRPLFWPLALAVSQFAAVVLLQRSVSQPMLMALDAALALAAAILAASQIDSAEPAVGFGLGSALSGLFLVGCLGELAVTALSSALIAGAASSGAGGREKQENAVDFPILLAMLSIAALTRFLGALLTHPVPAAACAAAGLALGYAGMKAARRELELSGHASVAGACWAAAGAAILGLNLLRFQALSLTSPLYALTPIASLDDLFLVYGQSIFSFLPLGAALAWRAPDSTNCPRWQAALPLCAGLFFLPIHHPASLAAGVYLPAALLALLGAIDLIGRKPWREEPALGWLGALGPAALIYWGVKVKDPFAEIELHRLNALAAGSRVVVRQVWNGRQSAVARFIDGAGASMRDGRFPHAHGDEAFWMAALPIGLRAFAGRVLVLGSGEAVAAQTATQLGCGVVSVGDGQSWPAALLRQKEKFDVVIVDIPRPLASPPGPFAGTIDFMRLLKDALLPQGLVAVWIPFPAFEGDVRGAAAALDVFPHRGAWARPGFDGILLIGSLSPIVSWNLPWLVKKIPDMDQAKLDQVGHELREWTDWLEAHPVRAATFDRSSAGFPAAHLISGHEVRPLAGRLGGAPHP